MKIEIKKGTSPLAEAFSAPFSPEEEIEYRKLRIAEDLLSLMKDAGVNRSELAKRMGVANSRITSMLDGTNNCTIETLVRAGHAIGATLEQTFVPEGMKGRWISYYENEVHAEFQAHVRPVKKADVTFHFERADTAKHDPADAA